MTLLEVIDRLCHITQVQSGIIRMQAEAIEQAKIADAVACELSALQKSADEDLREVESFLGGKP